MWLGGILFERAAFDQPRRMVARDPVRALISGDLEPADCGEAGAAARRRLGLKLDSAKLCLALRTAILGLAATRRHRVLARRRGPCLAGSRP